MIFLMSKKSRKENFRSNRQLAYGVILVVVIPLLVVANSLFFIRQFNEVLTREQHRQAILIGQITESFIRDQINSTENLQKLIEETLENSSELTDITISKPEGNDLIIWASIEEKRIGIINESNTSFFAVRSKRSVAQRIAVGNEQFWDVQYPIFDDAGELIAVLELQLSTQDIDSDIGSLILRSFIILAVIVLVIILLLASNTRLFQYAILYRKLKEIDQAKDDFISIASHELRTPITAMRNYFSMLLEGSFGKLSKDTRESIVMMTKNAERLNNLVEDLLNVSRLQQGRIKIDSKNIDMIPIVTEAVANLQSTAKEKRLELKFENKNEQVMAHADPERVRQIVVNVIGNALKYTEKGSVTVSISKDPKTILVKVKDTGIGMSAEDQQRLFEKFYRVINKKTQNIVGTGLGLWLTREILELMDGKIFIDSIENVGTQVTISLPFANDEVEK